MIILSYVIKIVCVIALILAVYLLIRPKSRKMPGIALLISVFVASVCDLVFLDKASYSQFVFAILGLALFVWLAFCFIGQKRRKE